MFNTYVPILILILLSAAFVAGLIGLAVSLGPKKSGGIKDEPFECGTAGTGDARGRHGAKFYLVAITFIIFDVEMVFFYPWAVNIKEFGWAGLFVILPFFLLLVVGLIYEFKRGVLDFDG